MSQESIPVDIRILDKEFRIACAEDEKDELLASAQYLDEQMKTIRRGGKVIGAERIAIMAALNIAHELLQVKREKQSDTDNISHRLRSLQDRIDVALNSGNQLEL